jgi:hypothetical protein
VDGRHRNGKTAAGKPHALGHFGDHTHVRVRVVPPGHQEHTGIAAYIDWQGDRHARKHHHVIQWNDS